MADKIPFDILKTFLLTGKGVELGQFLPPDADIDAIAAQLETGIETKHLADSISLPIADGSITLAKQADVATSTVFYRKTAGTGVPQVQTLATLKTDLGLTGTNSGDKTFKFFGFTGADSTGAPVSVALSGAVVGMKVAGVSNNTSGTTVSSSFESVITIVDKIQQTGAINLSAAKLSVLLTT